MKFAFVIVETPESRAAIRADRAAHRRAIETWMTAQAAAGVLVGGEAFETEGAAPATVRRRGGTLEVTDAPFAGPVETLGGYVLVEVADRAAAIALARTWPASGETIEVRPLGVAGGADEP